jgi:hypothetical protein
MHCSGPRVKKPEIAVTTERRWVLPSRYPVMKKILVLAPLVAALLAPLGTAGAQTRDWGSFCTTGLALNFCGSVQVSAVASAGGGTDVTFTILNTSGGALGGDASAVFTGIGLDNIGLGDPTVGPVTVTMNGTTFSGWQVEVDKQGGGGVNVDLLADTENGINNGISSACAPVNNRIATGGIGGCPGGSNTVTISFHISSTFDLADASLFIKAQGAQSSVCVIGSECAPITTSAVPEPATLLLVGTGMLALAGGRRRSRRRAKHVESVQVSVE